MPMDVNSIRLLQEWPLFDNTIVRHSFVPYMRDYEVLVKAPERTREGKPLGTVSLYRFLFSHCPAISVETGLPAATWQVSHSDEFCDLAAWEAAGSPEGFVWGVGSMEAYPGARLVTDSILAREWSNKLGTSFHEVRIETNVHRLAIIFERLDVTQCAVDDPDTGNSRPIEPTTIGPPDA